MEPRTPRSTNSLLGLSSIRIAELPQSLMGGRRDLRPLTLDPAHGNTAQVGPNLRKQCWKPVRPGAANQFPEIEHSGLGWHLYSREGFFHLEGTMMEEIK
ncbi:uncharacterized protein LOC106505288 isoform X2 [Sus scrofa]|uniref:uncharacterized protein LOC106505288 isoform X2 n=1 Tax=Sus scrofa TaxID=9823 RepID=UPI000A2B1F02|nr:uncharacterized protein LOC106505288 isoform X2 [Sus scrofa]